MDALIPENNSGYRIFVSYSRDDRPVVQQIIGSLPGEMIEQIQAVAIAQDGVGQLTGALTLDTIRSLVEKTARRNGALYTRADYPQSRAAMIAQHCEDVLALRRFGKVRQKGGLTTFHVPTELIEHRKWRERYDPRRSIFLSAALHSDQSG